MLFPAFEDVPCSMSAGVRRGERARGRAEPPEEGVSGLRVPARRTSGERRAGREEGIPWERSPSPGKASLPAVFISLRLS